MLVGRLGRIKNKLFWGVVDQKKLRTTDLDDSCNKSLYTISYIFSSYVNFKMS